MEALCGAVMPLPTPTMYLLDVCSSIKMLCTLTRPLFSGGMQAKFFDQCVLLMLPPLLLLVLLLLMLVLLVLPLTQLSQRSINDGATLEKLMTPEAFERMRSDDLRGF